MTAPCGSSSCPVPEKPPTNLRSVVWNRGTLAHRGHKRAYPAEQLVPSEGDTRFAPLADVEHVYVSTTEIGALLESALHDATPPAPRIQVPTLREWAEAVVRVRRDVRLFDLRDDELGRLGIRREQLVSTPPFHYRCTRRWAAQIHGRPVGGHETHGLLWHSRQAELHARALPNRPALAHLINEHPTEVAVIWSPPAPARLLDKVHGQGLGPLNEGPGWEFVEDLMGLLEIVSHPN